ncbi:MAG: Jag N-terminal domain-containing protein [Desulfovibrio sp.]|jgi:spoIIIJ-associated protein|nr:Jag N-terminal domain-containing protein [Desulfovibrio sp.]
MDGFKEFQGSDLDGAIDEACDYFNLAREKLEIEIVQDAKSGIFGIVGARKAKIRARRVQLPEPLKNLLGGKTREAPAREPAQAAFQPGRRAGEKDASPDRDALLAVAVAEEPDSGFPEEDLDDTAPDEPRTPLEKIDAERLKSLLMEAADRIIRKIVGEDAEITADICRDRVRVTVHCARDSGLLIGREGQTLGAVQYLLSRIVSRKLDAAVRVQLDAGDYRRNQEDKLKALALALADRARRSGRALSTRPMSSYHRRIIHLSLQNMQDIQTRSTGEGPLKRVVIQRQKTEK